MIKIEHDVSYKSMCYYVYYPPGSGGHFICTLIKIFLYKMYKPMLTKFGSCHNQTNPLYTNIDYEKLNTATLYNINRTIDLLRPMDTTRPIIMHSHSMPFYDKLFKKFPLSKIIIIEVPKDMIMRALVNLYFKAFVENTEKNKNKENVFTSNLLETINENNSWELRFSEFKKVKDPNLLTIEQTQKLFETINLDDLIEYKNFTDAFTNNLDKPELPYKYGAAPSPPFEKFVPEEYKQNVSYISYKDILYDKEKILQILSDLTQKPITNKILEFYKQYLDKQDELIQTKAPWINI